MRALRVELENGRTDILVCGTDAGSRGTAGGKYTLHGFFGFRSEQDGVCTCRYRCDASQWDSAPSAAGCAGILVGFTREMAEENELLVRLQEPAPDAAALAGRLIGVENDGVRNACYIIRGCERTDEGLYRVSLGDCTLIRCRDGDGYQYDVEEGQRCWIPLSGEA